MRKVINKKVYDTKTAELVAEYYNGYSQRDFRYLYEGLYRTRKGQFFVHGDGGAMTKYGERVGNQTSKELGIKLPELQQLFYLQQKRLMSG